MIVTIVGARPNFIKAALVSRELKRRNIKELLVHTGQHYDRNLSGSIFKDLQSKLPDINLGIGPAIQGEQTARMLIEIEKMLLRVKPTLVVVYGDTNSTLAGVLAAAKLNIPIVHIEAGERSGDKSSPEEINRIISDHLARANCCATKKAARNLRAEGLKSGAVFTGDIMLDLLLERKRLIGKEKLAGMPSTYILFTLHRAENVDNCERLKKIFGVVGKLAIPVVLPLHPRTENMMKTYRIKPANNMKIMKPANYSQIVELMMRSQRVITDSGGLQKEAYWLGVPCITLLEKTAWTETLTGNWNQLIGDNVRELLRAVRRIPAGPRKISDFGRGNAAHRIGSVIQQIHGK